MLLSAGAIGGKVELLGALRTFDELGIRFYATGGTPAFLEECGLLAERLHCRWTAVTQASSKRYAMGRSILS
jgi:hypothetical protein